MKAKKEYIWIADSNLFHSPYSRRYLWGLAAYSGANLAVVPALMDVAEIPSQLAYGLLTHRHENDDDLCGKLTLDALAWMERKTQQKEGLIQLFESPDETADMRQRILPNFTIFKREPLSLSVGNDYHIITEALAVGCSNIATLNFRSINHEKLNNKVASELGYNDKFIVYPDELSKRMVTSPVDEALIIAAMSIANTPRAIDVEMASWDRFRTKLEVTFTDTAVRTRLALVDGELTQVELIEQGIQMAQTPRFMRARQLEEELQSLRLDALSWGYERNLCVLNDIEQQQVNQHHDRRRDGTDQGRGMDR